MKRAFYFFGCIFLLTVFGFGEPMTLTKEDCFDLTLENNTDLKESSLSLDSSERSYKNSWNLFLPSLSADVSLSKSHAATGDQTRLSPGLSAQYTFRPSLGDSIRRLRLAHDSMLISYEEARRQTLLAVESEFYYLISARSALEIKKKNIDLAGQIYNQTLIKFNNGLVPELEVLQAKVNEANLVPQYSSSEASYKKRFKEFLLVLGVDPMTEVILDGDIEIEDIDLKAEDLITAFLENRADIALQRKSVSILKSSLGSRRKERLLPTLSVSARWNDSVADPFSSGAWDGHDFDGTTTVSIGLSIPLDGNIPGSQDDLDEKDARDSLTAAEMKLETLIDEAGLEIINLVNALETDKANLELSELNLQLSETSYKTTQTAFEKGTASRTSLDDAQQDLLTARQNLLESRFAYKKDLIALRGALGLNIDDPMGRNE